MTPRRVVPEPTLAEVLVEVAALRKRVVELEHVIDCHAESIANRRLETFTLLRAVDQLVARARTKAVA